MKGIKKNIIRAIGAILIGVLIYFIGAFLYDNYSSRTKFLNYTVNETPDLFKSLKDIGDSVTLKVNAKKINSVSMIEINVFNYTDSDFEEVPIYIQFNKSGDNELSILSSTYYDHNNSQEGVDLIDLKNSESAEVKKIGYRISTANRGERAVFRLKVLFQGPILPKYSVQLDKKGTDIKLFSGISVLAKVLWSIVFLLTFVTIFLLWIALSIKKNIKERKLMYTELEVYIEGLRKKIKSQDKLIEELNKK